MRVETKGRNRYYHTPGGKFPSVTSILSATDSEEDKARLRKWQHKMDSLHGKGHASKISGDALTKGKLIHSAIESHYRYGQEIEVPYEEWNKLRSFLKVIQPITLECPVYHPSGYAGTIDCVGHYTDELYVIDWKTSKRMKRKSWINNYFLQITAYAHAWNFMHPNQIIRNGLIVVISPPNSLQLFDFEIAEYADAWMERLDKFYSL